MAYAALTAFMREAAPAGNLHQSSSLPDGVIVTAVLPGGCQLKCSFCIVSQRDERAKASAFPKLTSVLQALAGRGDLGAAAIVGDEPLQKHTWPAVDAFLRAAHDLNVPSAIITNGVELARYAADLAAFPQTRILVSLDATGERHDKVRGRAGAFKAISEGLDKAVTSPDLRERISIAAILMPNNSEDIVNVIRYAGERGIPRVLISPLLTSGRHKPLAIHRNVLTQGLKHIATFLEVAAQSNVKLVFSDEFGILDGAWERKLANAGLAPTQPAQALRLVRIDAQGRIETAESMRSGVPTGVVLRPGQVPEDSLISNITALLPSRQSGRPAGKLNQRGPA